jgi:hypothetical protein
MEPAWKHSADDLEGILRQAARKAWGTVSNVVVRKQGGEVFAPSLTFTLDCPYPPLLGSILVDYDIRMSWDGGKTYTIVNA